MKVDDAAKKAEAREREHIKRLERGRKELARRVPPQPARDDRGEQAPWRPGDR